jgi:hypothetical protein
MQQKEFYHATGQGSAAIGTSQMAVPNIANVDGHATRKAAVRTPAQKLETARQSVRIALRLAADEDPSYQVLDDIARGLSRAVRELEEAAMAFAVMQRRDAR